MQNRCSVWCGQRVELDHSILTISNSPTDFLLVLYMHVCIKNEIIWKLLSVLRFLFF